MGRPTLLFTDGMAWALDGMVPMGGPPLFNGTPMRRVGAQPRHYSHPPALEQCLELPTVVDRRPVHDPCRNRPRDRPGHRPVHPGPAVGADQSLTVAEKRSHGAAATLRHSSSTRASPRLTGAPAESETALVTDPFVGRELTGG